MHRLFPGAVDLIRRSSTSPRFPPRPGPSCRRRPRPRRPSTIWPPSGPRGSRASSVCGGITQILQVTLLTAGVIAVELTSQAAPPGHCRAASCRALPCGYTASQQTPHGLLRHPSLSDSTRMSTASRSSFHSSFSVLRLMLLSLTSRWSHLQKRFRHHPCHAPPWPRHITTSCTMFCKVENLLGDVLVSLSALGQRPRTR
mmetsp:Transcript_103829/g.332761  ORF Transcript_103829/g.332761 Transcript_103829/m.332761 type:complete len:200 (-) Transcript_103829:266-865(-)